LSQQWGGGAAAEIKGAGGTVLLFYGLTWRKRGGGNAGSGKKMLLHIFRGTLKVCPKTISCRKIEDNSEAYVSSEICEGSS